MGSGNGSLGKIEEIYPERRGWGRVLSSRAGSGSEDFLHMGYTSARTKQCPCCGNWPVFERAVEDRGIPATVFVAICPRCEMRVDGSGTLSDRLTAWNRAEFTKDTVLVHHRMRQVDPDAAENLSNRVVADAIDEAVTLMEMKKKTQAEIKLTRNAYAREIKEIHLREILSGLRKVQHFIDTSPLMLNHDPDAVLAMIRKRAYPELSFEERQELPLKLVNM